MLDADGDPTAATTPDIEFSGDNGAAGDCAEELSATSGMDGMGLMTLSGAETNYSTVALNQKVASGPKHTLVTLYPRVLASVGTGTLSAGSAGGGTLGTLLAYDVTGCFIKTTDGTGGGGTGGANNQVRKIVTYNTSTGAFTVEPNWETTPDNTTTYAVLLPEGMTLGQLKAFNQSGVDVAKWDGTSIASSGANGFFNMLAFWSNQHYALAQAGGAATITLDTSAVNNDDYYNDAVVTILSGAGIGQTRRIASYVGATRVATVTPAWDVQPDNSSLYMLIGRIES